MSHSGPRTADGDHWDNDIITAILILSWATLSSYVTRCARGRAVNPRCITGIYFLACPGAGQLLFAARLQSMMIPARTCLLMKSSGRRTWSRPDLISTREPGAREPNARLLRARWSNLRGAAPAVATVFFPSSESTAATVSDRSEDERNWLAT